jgi:hypothetical protein
MTEQLKLAYNFNAIEKLYEEGLDLLGGALTDADFRRPPNIVLMYWAGSLHLKPELTIDEARAEIANGSVKDLILQITNCLKESLGSEEENTGEEDEGNTESESKSSSPEDQI